MQKGSPEGPESKGCLGHVSEDLKTRRLEAECVRQGSLEQQNEQKMYA